jgi:anti-sigma regulatory factor (Ser/Thr protein kinase)
MPWFKEFALLKGSFNKEAIEIRIIFTEIKINVEIHSNKLL